MNLQASPESWRHWACHSPNTARYMLNICSFSSSFTPDILSFCTTYVFNINTEKKNMTNICFETMYSAWCTVF